MNTRRWTRWLLGLGSSLALLAAVGCGGDGDADTGDGADEADEVVTVAMEGIRFDPDTVHVKVGQTLRLEFVNHDPVVHDFSVDEASFVVVRADGGTHDHGTADHHDDDADGHHDDADGGHDDADGHHDDADGHHDDADGHHDDDGEAAVMGQSLHVAADPNGDAILVLQALEPGEYEVYCSVTGHRDAGMVGKLIVEG